MSEEELLSLPDAGRDRGGVAPHDEVPRAEGVRLHELAPVQLTDVLEIGRGTS